MQSQSLPTVFATLSAASHNGKTLQSAEQLQAAILLNGMSTAKRTRKKSGSSSGGSGSKSPGSDYEDDMPDEPRSKSQTTIEERRAVRLEKNRQSAALSRTRKKEAVTKLQNDLSRVTTDNQALRDQLDLERRSNWECRLHVERLEKQMLAVCTENLEFRSRLNDMGVSLDARSASLPALLAASAPPPMPAAVAAAAMPTAAAPGFDASRSSPASSASEPGLQSPKTMESGLHEIAALIANGHVSQLPVGTPALAMAAACLPAVVRPPSVAAAASKASSAAQALHALSSFSTPLSQQVQGLPGAIAQSVPSLSSSAAALPPRAAPPPPHSAPHVHPPPASGAELSNESCAAQAAPHQARPLFAADSRAAAS
eukprot:TRINITY_DN3063_c0_g2_i1.p1 TRINITY_DN3063_c0_g2~~TRINITY_DN3063_c0_g2_i1.p1  ORF type:complete len:371 (+),score=97.47 TRINITY_DN3063_c0_g2_i1:121-1233(+)